MTAAEEAKRLLSGVKAPFNFIDTGDGAAHGFPGARTGSFRDASGRSLVVPVPESASMIAGMPSTVEFMAKAPEVMQKLLDELERAKS